MIIKMVLRRYQDPPEGREDVKHKVWTDVIEVTLQGADVTQDAQEIKHIFEKRGYTADDGK